MPKDEPKPMTRERLAEIRELANKGYKGGMPDAVGLLTERVYSSLALLDAVAEIDRLRSLQDNDTALLDWASTNFAGHSISIRDAIEDDGYTLRDALRDARDGTLYEEDDDE